MKKSVIAVLSVLLMSACSSEKYITMPDGSKPVLYPADNVMRWPVVDGAHVAPDNTTRIWIDDTVKFEPDVRLGAGVKIGRNSSIGEDTTLLPNVTVGTDTTIRGDVVVGANTTIGNHVSIWGDAKIGAGSVVEDGATVAKWKILPAGAVVKK